MQVINKTPHPLVLVVDDGATLTIAPSLPPARVTTSQDVVDTLLVAGIDIPVITMTTGSVIDLPDPAPDTIYVVSAVVRSAVADRKDVYSPGDLKRDPQGNVVGCSSLIANN